MKRAVVPLLAATAEALPRNSTPWQDGPLSLSLPLLDSAVILQLQR